MPLNYLDQQWKLETPDCFSNYSKCKEERCHFENKCLEAEKDNHHTSEWKYLRIEYRKDLNDIEMQIHDTRLKLTQDILSLPISPNSLFEKEKELQTLQQEADCLNRIITILDRNLKGVE
jgi:hypothetical protein